MKERHVTENELSAYLDDAAEDPLAIAQHLAACKDCARHYHALRDLSDSLHALPEPAIPPEFLTRVMAHVRETDIVPARISWTHWAYRFHQQKVGLAAAGICLMIALSIVFWATPSETGKSPISPSKNLNTPIQAKEMPQPPPHQPVIARNEPQAEEALDTAPLSEEEIILALCSTDWPDTGNDLEDTHGDPETDYSENDNSVAEEIVFDILQEGSMS